MRSVHYKVSREPTDQVQVAIEFEERLMPSKHNELDRDPDQQSVLSARISLADTPNVAVDMAMLNDLAAAQVAGEPDLIVT